MRNLIGFFDSGAGGISVLHEAVRLLPREHFLFYGDNANAPYGTRPLEEIRRLCERCVGLLMEEGVKAIVLACNTATSAYAEILRAQVEIPVIGMEPAIKPAQLSRRGGEVLALATEATLALPKFRRLMERYGSHVLPVAGRGFVELVESGEWSGPRAEAVVDEVLSPYYGRRIDSVVLGCTHYPFLAPLIQSRFPEAELFDGRRGTVLQLQRRLQAENLLSDDPEGSVEMRSSGGEEAVEKMLRLYRAMEEMSFAL